MIDAFKIEGGQKLEGLIEVSGAKNAALPIIVATLVEKGEYILKNVPNLKDIRTIFNLIEELGLIVEKLDNNTYKVINNGLTKNIASYEKVKQMRASFLVLGPMLLSFEDVEVSLPGGCAIGTRPVDIHLKGFEMLGAKIYQEHGYIFANSKNMKGTDISLSFPSVGATQNLMMCAVKLKGTTRIYNAAKEPEIYDLGNMLNKMGAKIKGLGTDVIEIEGVEKLKAVEYEIMYDRIEAGTFVIASIINDGRIKIKNANIEDLGIFKNELEKMGVKFEKNGDILEIKSKLKDLSPINIKTQPHPGFPTDMQSQMMLLLSLIPGVSQVEETVFENRFMHIAEFNRMGTKIDVKGNLAIITGVDKLSSAEVMSSDLRAGAALVLASLYASGESIVRRIYHIDRGYENLEDKLRKIGAKIERIKVEV